MRGCIVKKGQRYYLKYYVAGKQIWKAAGTRKRDAERMLTDIVHQIDRGEYRELKPIMFAEFADKWLKEHVGGGSLKPSTQEFYRQILEHHLVPYFGGYELAQITLEEVQRFVSVKVKGGKLSAQTINHLITVLKGMSKHAVRWGYLRNNPALYVERPKILDKEMDFFTKEEIGVFLAHVPPMRYALFLTAIMTGLRQGELLAMKWGNLDWNLGQYFVKESLYQGRFLEPKSRKSKRAIDLAPTLLRELKQHQVRQYEKRLQAGSNYQEFDLIFCTESGTPLDPKNLVKRAFNPALKAAGIRHIRFHDLRHTYTALLIAQGESPKYIQNQLGHASIQTTLDRYGHLMPDTHKEAAKRLDEALFGRSSRKIVENQ